MSAPNPRNQAGSVQLHGGTGNILHMVSLTDFLEAYKSDTTFRIQTPETIDPENTNPHAPWVVSRIDGVGASSLAVARVLLQGNEMLNSGVFVDGFDKNNVLKQLHNCKEQLVICEQTASRISGRVESILEQIQSSGINRDNHGRALNPFPQTQELIADTTTFLITAKRVIAEATALIANTRGIEVQGPNFTILQQRLITLLGQDDPLTAYITAQEPTVKYLVELRNFQEHGNTIRSTVVRDFHVVPDGSISPPVLHLSDQPPQPLHEILRSSAIYLVQLTEAVFVYSLMAKLIDTIPFSIMEIPNSEILMECPIKFRLSIDPSALSLGRQNG